MSNLIRHIERSTATKFGSKHDDAKRADGWYNLSYFDFAPEFTPSERVAAKSETKRDLASMESWLIPDDDPSVVGGIVKKMRLEDYDVETEAEELVEKGAMLLNNIEEYDTGAEAHVFDGRLHVYGSRGLRCRN